MGSTNIARIASIAEDLKAHAGLLDDPRADRKGTIRIMLSLANALKASLKAELVFEERLSPSSVQAPKVVPPVQQAAQKLSPSKEKPPRQGDPWTADEDRRLTDAFDAGVPQEQLAERHRRSRGAIRSRLEKLGRLKPEQQHASQSQVEEEPTWPRS